MNNGSGNGRRVTPVTIAVMVSMFFAGMILSISAAIGGSYALTLHAIHTSQSSQLAGAKQECRALRALDDAREGITFPHVSKTHPSEEALTKLFAGIHQVYKTSECPAILNDTFRFP